MRDIVDCAGVIGDGVEKAGSEKEGDRQDRGAAKSEEEVDDDIGCEDFVDHFRWVGVGSTIMSWSILWNSRFEGIGVRIAQ